LPGGISLCAGGGLPTISVRDPPVTLVSKLIASFSKIVSEEYIAISVKNAIVLAERAHHTLY
jgi:hypothetical protein